MSNYPGYPRFVLLAMPKSGTKTMGAALASLGMKVYDVMQATDHAKQFNLFGKGEIEFPELAKVWEDNEYDVIIEPAGIYWTWMAEHWPNTKFIHVVRDEESWKKSFLEFFKIVFEDKSSLEHVLYRNPHISPTHKEAQAFLDAYARNIVNLRTPWCNETLDEIVPWPRFITRMYRQFHADVQVNAPKDRTLFNYNVKDGWPKLREFLGVENSGDEFPHLNKGGDAKEWIETLFDATEYDRQYKKELAEYLKKHGVEVNSSD